MLRVGVAAMAMLAACASANAAGWAIQRNEPDAADKSRSTFVADLAGDRGMLVIRCLRGKISLLIATNRSDAMVGDRVELKLTADEKESREEKNAQVLTVTSFVTSIQFGDPATLDYLEGAQKIAVTMTLPGESGTSFYAVDKSFDEVIAKARRACGVQPAGVAATSRPRDDKQQVCRGAFDLIRNDGRLGPNPDEAGFMSWCAAQIDARR